jgi:hypothetical protein
MSLSLCCELCDWTRGFNNNAMLLFYMQHNFINWKSMGRQSITYLSVFVMFWYSYTWVYSLLSSRLQKWYQHTIHHSSIRFRCFAISSLQTWWMWGGKWQPWQVESFEWEKNVDFILYTWVKVIKKDFDGLNKN